MNDANNNDDRSDGLDRLLSEWHADNADAARDGRDRLLDSLEIERPAVAVKVGSEDPKRPRSTSRMIPGRGLLAAALFVLVAMLSVLIIPGPQGSAMADLIQVSEGGVLEAFDRDGELIGPCPLRYTDVSVEITGPIASVSLTQRYSNPYDLPIEAVYTFPISNRAAVDRMTMTVVDPDGNERVVEGEVKERELARRIYEQARDAGYVASLLEQERPNIFTQSVANIAPGATVTVEIGYLEVISARDGEYAFEFPTVVGPRYIPGVPTAASMSDLPEGVEVRRGVILRGPGAIVPFALPGDRSEFLERSVDGSDGLTFGIWMNQKILSTPDRFETSMVDTWTPARILELMTAGIRIDRPASAGTIVESRIDDMSVEVTGIVDYDAPANDERTPGPRSDDVGAESFTLYEGGYGVIGDRWFCWRPPAVPESGTGFASDTDQVTDASRITPMPVRPDQRAGHDISIDVRIDTGGVAITSIQAPLHEVVERREGDGRMEVTLLDRAMIPNRDFVLRWRLADDAIAESVFTHVVPGDDGDVVSGGYLTMVLAPPAATPSEDVRPRELVFVLDTSGSMRGFPIEKAKDVMTRAIDSMRSNDSFNLITFAGSTRMLWEQPRPATSENRALANAFIEARQGGGGTEMMTAINAALTRNAVVEDRLTVDELKNLPADGRVVRVRIPFGSFAIRQLVAHPDLGRHQDGIVENRDDIDLKYSRPLPERPAGVEDMLINGDSKVDMDGRWVTQDGRRIMIVDTAIFAVDAPVNPDPMRIVVFMTDGQVGNDQAIVQAVRDNAESTRVFALGVGNSVNRFLLDDIARQGRGAVDYVLLADGADAVVERLAKRIQTPVLTDIDVRIEGVDSYGILPANPAGLLPDLFDDQPIMLHARYRPPVSGSVEGAVVISGNTGAGRYERRIPVLFSSKAAAHASIATLWGRAKVDEVLAPHLAAVEAKMTPPTIREEVVALGEGYSLVTPFTSFVAVEKSRVAVDGRSVLVTVPIELPEGTEWIGVFGPDCPEVVRERAFKMAGDSTHRISNEVDDPREGSSNADELMSIRNQIDSENQSDARSDLRYGIGGAVSASGGGGSRGSRSRSSKGGVSLAGGGRAFGASGGMKPPPPPSAVVGSGPERDEVFESFDAAIGEPPVPSDRDLDRIARTIDRRLLLLALGAASEDVNGIPTRGLDGRPWINESTVEVTILFSSDGSLAPSTIESLGLSIQGESVVADSRLVVARIRIDRLLDLGEVEGILRVVPTTGS